MFGKMSRNEHCSRKMKSFVTIASAFLIGLAGLAQGQLDEPPLRDREILTKQVTGIYGALREPVAKVVQGTVEVRVWKKRVGYGTVVAKERVLVKWSEVKRDIRSLSCRTSRGEWLPATLVGIYREPDLALLQVKGLKARPVELKHNAENLRLGTFLALARPDGEAQAMGVVSVAPRSLREADRAFLGIEMDLSHTGDGVRVRGVSEGTAADRAKLKSGDVITKVVGKKVNGTWELSTLLQRLKPGDIIEVSFRRDDEEKEVKVELGERSVRRISSLRMERMNNLGGHRYSDVRDGFRDVIQSDMQLDPEDCGAPVINLDGKVVGIAVARAGRIKTFIMPAAAIQEILKKEPAQPRLEEVAGRAQPLGNDPEGEDPFEVMRRKMEEMRRLMEEMEKLDR